MARDTHYIVRNVYRKENIMYEDEKIIFIDTDTLTMEEQEEMIQEENKNEQAKKL